MSKNFFTEVEQLKKEIKSNPLSNLILIFILIFAFFVRVHRLNDLLQFYYDQGRDALIVWDLLHKGKLFLIGPITGLKGIFLGPLYYYLIAPFYLLGGGNPVYPSAFLAFLSTIAILVLYVLGSRMHSRQAGLIAATIGAFSYYIVSFSRWLSNPNPILLTSLIFLWGQWEIADLRQKSNVKSQKFNPWWILTTLMVGVSLQLESASAFFYIPIFVVFAIWQILRRNIPDRKVIILSTLAFLATLLPQIIFNFRHGNILFNNFKALFLEERAFRPFTKFILEERIKYFWSVFSTKFFPSGGVFSIFFTTIAGASLISSFKDLKKPILPIFSIFLITPIVGYILFQGNYGNIYDYYMSGYYFPFILLFSIALGELWNKKLGFLMVLFFFIRFFYQNIPLLKNYLTSSVATRPISLEEQLKAVNWVYEDAKNRGNFNLDVYVPPVIPYAYDYLFLWQGNKKCGESLCGLTKDETPLLYTLIEPDNDHPERINSWLERQKAIADVEEEVKTGHIIVQRRKRI